MKFIEHSNLEGKHAIFSASSWRWINDESHKLSNRIVNAYAATVGTILHGIAKKHIKFFIKMSKSDKKHIRLELLNEGIPPFVVDELDLSNITENLMMYVNDAIGFRMTPEVVLYHSPYCFGTADTISYSDKNKYLRIHDLKTGKISGHIEQLMIYAALFCIEYEKNPNDIKIELRIYQECEVNIVIPNPDDIRSIMDKCIEIDRYLNNSSSDIFFGNL